MIIPNENQLKKTGPVDYYDWNYKFPIKYVQKYRFSRILNLMGNVRYPALLEVGMGSGIFLPELSKHCEKLFACDIYSDLDHVVKLLDEFKVKEYKLETQSIEKTTYPDSFFDCIIAVSVLEFVGNLQSAIEEIRRILKKDGVFITICPMHSWVLDAFLSIYSQKKPSEEFGDARIYVGKTLEENFHVAEKGYMLPFIGKYFPIYTHYKLMK